MKRTPGKGVEEWDGIWESTNRIYEIRKERKKKKKKGLFEFYSQSGHIKNEPHGTHYVVCFSFMHSNSGGIPPMRFLFISREWDRYRTRVYKVFSEKQIVYKSDTFSLPRGFIIYRTRDFFLRERKNYN